MSNSSGRRITSLSGISNISSEDLLEIVDKNGDPNGNPISYSVSISDLNSYINSQVIESTLTNTIVTSSNSSSSAGTSDATARGHAVDDAIDKATASGPNTKNHHNYVLVLDEHGPATNTGYDTGVVTYDNRVQLIEEGQQGFGLSVRAYGAGGADSKEENQAFSEACSAAEANNTRVIIPAGTYGLNDFSTEKNIEIIGLGTNQTVLKEYNNNASNYIFEFFQGNNVPIQNKSLKSLAIQGNGTKIGLNVDNIDNALIDSVNIDGCDTGSKISLVENRIIYTNCRFLNCNEGVDVDSADQNTPEFSSVFSFCHFYNNTTGLINNSNEGIDATRCFFESNTTNVNAVNGSILT